MTFEKAFPLLGPIVKTAHGVHKKVGKEYIRAQKRTWKEVGRIPKNIGLVPSIPEALPTSPLPKASNVLKGNVFEKERRRKAKKRSGSLLSRGLLSDPTLAMAQLANALG